MALATDIEMAERGENQVVSPSSSVGISDEDNRSSTVAEDECEALKAKLAAAHRFLKYDCRYRNGRFGTFRASKGVAGVVAFEEQHSNMGFLRNFTHLGKLLVLDLGHELAVQFDELQAMIEEEEKDNNTACPQAQEEQRPLGTGPVSEAVHERLQQCRKLYLEYMATLKAYVFSQKEIHEAHLDPIFDFIEEMQCRDILKEGDLAYYKGPEEMCTIRPPEPGWLMWLIYSRIGKWFIRILFSKGPSQDSRYVPRATANVAISVMYLIGTAILLLGPVAIMLLVDLDRPRSYAVIAPSTIVFAGFACSMNRYNAGQTFLAALGYLAVMAAFTEGQRFLG